MLQIPGRGLYGLRRNGRCVDIFVTETVDGKIYFKKRNKKNSIDNKQLVPTIQIPALRDGGRFYVTEEEIFPLTLCKFGNFQVWAPHNPHGFLFPWFGNRCFEEVFVKNHRKRKPWKIAFADLLLKDKGAAQPQGPLKDETSEFFKKYALQNG